MCNNDKGYPPITVDEWLDRFIKIRLAYGGGGIVDFAVIGMALDTPLKAVHHQTVISPNGVTIIVEATNIK